MWYVQASETFGAWLAQLHEIDKVLVGNKKINALSLVSGQRDGHENPHLMTVSNFSFLPFLPFIKSPNSWFICPSSRGWNFKNDGSLCCPAGAFRFDGFFLAKH